MKKIVIPIALLFAGLKVSAQNGNQRKFSFLLGVKSPNTLTFNDVEQAQNYAQFDVKMLAGTDDIGSLSDGGASYALPTITATQPFELRAGLASAFWKKQDGSDSNIGCNTNDKKAINVELLPNFLPGTQEGRDLKIDKMGIRLSSNATSLVAHTDNTATVAKGIKAGYRLYPHGVKMGDLKDNLSLVVDYSLVAK